MATRKNKDALRSRLTPRLLTLILIVLGIIYLGHRFVIPTVTKEKYINQQYGYSIEFPTDWHLREDNASRITVFSDYREHNPYGVAFTVECHPNPQYLDAYAFWQSQQKRADRSPEHGEGWHNFTSTTRAYMSSNENVQHPYFMFAVTKSDVACEILASRGRYNKDIPAEMKDVLKSFRWL